MNQPNTLEIHPIDFAWNRQAWSIRPTDQLHPHTGEYLVQRHNDPMPIPMNITHLCRHLGLTPPAEPVPLRTLATFLELTGQVTHLPLASILHNANTLRLKH